MLTTQNYMITTNNLMGTKTIKVIKVLSKMVLFFFRFQHYNIVGKAKYLCLFLSICDYRDNITIITIKSTHFFLR